MRTDTIASRLLFTTLRIQVDDGRVGTGVICNYPVSASGSGAFLVTNKHVIKESEGGTLTFSLTDAAGQPTPERFERRCRNDLWRWTGHRDAEVDVAVLPISGIINQAPSIHYRAVSRDTMLTDEQTLDLDAVEEVWLVGYPSGIHDRVNNLPVVRRGITATPFAVDYEGTPRFVIDASVFPGSSGSPVYLYDPLGMRRGADGVLRFGGAPRFFFLGVLGAGYRRTNSGLMLAEPTDAELASEMLDLGIVYKARTIIETIERLVDDWHAP